MKPILFYLGSIPIPAYFFFQLLGASIALLVALATAKRDHWPTQKQCIIATLLAIVIGYVGAKLLFLFHHMDLYASGEMSLAKSIRVGFTLYGHLFSALIAVSIYSYFQKEPILKSLDFLVPYLALAYTFMRFGCFMNGCCYGTLCKLPWGIHFPTTSGPAHPVQLYEMLLYALLFAFLYFLHKQKDFDGQITGLFLMLFACIRLFTEIVRFDTHPDWVLINFNQVISIFTLAGGWVFYLLLHRKFQQQ